MQRQYLFFLLLFITLFAFLFSGCETNWDWAPISYQVFGVIVDEEGQGVKGVTLNFSGDFTGSTLSDEEGHWSGVLEGAVTITPGKEGYIFTPDSRQVTGREKNIRFTAIGGQFLLSLLPSRGGSIISSPLGDSFEEGSRIRLEAIPKLGWFFKEWQGHVTGSENPTYLVMDDHKSLSGVFGQEDLDMEHLKIHVLDLHSGEGRLILEEYGPAHQASVILFSKDGRGATHTIDSLITRQGDREDKGSFTLSSFSEEIGDPLEGPFFSQAYGEALENHLWASKQDPLLQLEEDLEIGHEEEFLVFSHGGYQEALPFVLRHMGDGYYLWVDASKEMKSSTAWEIGRIFGENIRPRVTEYFGRVPTKESFEVLGDDDGIHLLFAPLKESTGYFHPFDLYSRQEYGQSNEGRFLYIRFHEEDDEDLLSAMLGSITANLQQMIFYQELVLAERDGGEYWVNRGLSQLALDLAGYGFQQGVAKDPILYSLQSPHQASLVQEEGPSGLAYLLFRYLFDTYGPGIIPAISQSSRSFFEAQESFTQKEFHQVFVDFAIALLLHQFQGVQKPYGFDSINFDLPSTYLSPGSSWVNASIKGWGLHYTLIGPGTGEDLVIEVEGANQDGLFQMILVEKRGGS